MADRETLGVYASRAAEYAQKFGKTGADRHLQAFMNELPKGCRVLDLGCGPGQAAATMLEAGFDVDAWDASPEMAAVGRESFGIEITVQGFEALDAEDTYDGIYANFSLLHAPKAEMPDHLARIGRALKPGGVFHIGLKSGKGEERDQLGRFYAYYEDDELTELLGRVGLSVISRDFGREVGLAGTDDPWMILKARKDD